MVRQRSGRVLDTYRWREYRVGRQQGAGEGEEVFEDPEVLAETEREIFKRR